MCDAARRGSRFSAFRTARDRVGDGLRRDLAFRESRAACFFVLADPRFGGGSFTPARRALDNPMAIACCGTRAMFSFANMLHLFPHKFARLGRWRLSFTRIFPGSFDCFLFWHGKMVSLQKVRLVVRWMFLTKRPPR